VYDSEYQPELRTGYFFKINFQILFFSCLNTSNIKGKQVTVNNLPSHFSCISEDVSQRLYQRPAYMLMKEQTGFRKDL